MKHLLFLTTVLSIVSCTQKEVTPIDEEALTSQIQAMVQKEVAKTMTQQGAAQEFLLSAAFREQIDQIGMVELYKEKPDLVVDYKNDKFRVSETTLTIKIFIRNDPILPSGTYFLNLCNGELMNILGQVVGTAAGAWNGCD